MSPRAIKLTLWVSLFIALPVPAFMMASGLVPPLRIAFLSAVMVAIAAEDGATGMMPILLGFMLGQTVFYSLLLWGFAALASRLLQRIGSQSIRRWVVGAAVASLLVIGCFDVYRTPLSSSGNTSNLARIFD